MMTRELMKASQNFELEDSDGDQVERDEMISALADRAVELSVEDNKPTPVEIRTAFGTILDQKQQDRLDELEDAMNEIPTLRTDFDKEIKDISAETDPKVKGRMKGDLVQKIEDYLKKYGFKDTRVLWDGKEASELITEVKNL